MTNDFFKNIQKSLDRHSPIILTSLGVLGFIGAVVVGIKATPKAVKKLETTELPEEPYEKVKTQCRILLPVYAQTIGLTLMSMSFIYGGAYLNKRRYAALSFLYYSSKKYFQKFEESTFEVVGKNKFQEINNRAMTPPPDATQNVVYISDKAVTKVWDSFSERILLVDGSESIRAVANDLNEELLLDGFIPVNEFYHRLGSPGIPYGNDIGWITEHGLIRIKFGACLDKDLTPLVVIGFEIDPKHPSNF